jgi:hypothetical protein
MDRARREILRDAVCPTKSTIGFQVDNAAPKIGASTQTAFVIKSAAQR